MVGDLKNGRTVHSLAKLLTRYSIAQIRYLSPPNLGMPENIREYVRRRNIPQMDCTSFDDALLATNVVYMTRIQKERMSEEEYQAYLPTREKYILTPKDVAKTMDAFRILHPLPRLDEISDELDLDRKAAYFRQAQNGLPVRMALLLMLFKGKGREITG